MLTDYLTNNILNPVKESISMFMQKLEPEAPQSQIPQTGEFAKVRSHVLQMQSSWDSFYQQLSQLESPYGEEFRKHNSDFSRAVDKILTAIETPTLTLATTGTTSSGKSTLVNLLCGADIMPRMAGEMSAGIVTIKHSANGKRLLKIEKTPGASWECGEWKNLSDNDIRDRLTKTMDTFNKEKQKRELSSPIIELTYPITCFFPNAGMLDLGDLPANTQFQIMDLPGKRNQDDKINSTVIQNCRRALSIVTCDMGQTDDALRGDLIKEVLEQVKLMGGSPARMLFALNRIDVFRGDPEPERREQEAVEETIKEIKEILHKELPEHRGILEDLSYSKLSSLPALLAWQMHSNQGEQRINAADKLDEDFGSLIEKAIRKALPRSVEKWEEVEFNKVRKSVWESSYAENFFPTLEKHIREHFAKLIVAPLLVEFEGIISHIINQANNTCAIEIESGNNSLINLDLKLKKDEEVIKGILRDYYSNLMRFPELIARNPSNLERLYSEDLGEFYNHDYFKSNILPAFSKTVTEPIQWASGIIEGVTQSLKSNKVNYTGTSANELPHRQRQKLDSICRSLLNEIYNDSVYNDVDSYQKLGDSRHYGRGYSIKAVNTDEKAKIKRIQTTFKDRLTDLSLLVQEIYEERVNKEADRIKYLIEEILKVFINSLNQSIKSNGFILTVHFDESINESTELEINSIEFDAEVNIGTHSEGNPWLLWLSDRDVNYLEIPPADKLHEMLTGHFEGVRAYAAKPLQQAITKYYEEVADKMEDYIDSVMDDVNAKLKVKRAESQKKHQKEELKWLQLRSSVNIINEQMQQLHNYKA